MAFQLKWLRQTEIVSFHYFGGEVVWVLTPGIGADIGKAKRDAQIAVSILQVVIKTRKGTEKGKIMGQKKGKYTKH